MKKLALLNFILTTMIAVNSFADWGSEKFLPPVGTKFIVKHTIDFNNINPGDKYATVTVLHEGIACTLEADVSTSDYETKVSLGKKTLTVSSYVEIDGKPWIKLAGAAYPILVGSCVGMGDLGDAMLLKPTVGVLKWAFGSDISIKYTVGKDIHL